MIPEFEFWPRWKPLPNWFEKMPTGHTERAILVRRKPHEPTTEARTKRRGGKNGKPAA